VHRGFLTCAKAIRSTVQEELAKQVALDQSISQIVFTGHSAGGAVSSLLFLGFAFNLPRQRK
jgi:putative lipase involved disintegration of autophagic bodies